MRLSTMSRSTIGIATGPYTVVQSIKETVTLIQPLIAAGTKQFAVVAITLQFTNAETAHNNIHRSQLVERSTRYFLETLRPLVRKTDRVFLEQQTMYFLLLEANLQGGMLVQERLWDALIWQIHHHTDTAILQPTTMAIGYSAFPIPYPDVQHCLEEASITDIYFEVRPDTLHACNNKQCEEQDNALPALARKLGIPYLPLIPRHASQKMTRIVSPQLARELHCYPLGCEQNTLTVAMSNLADRQTLDRLRQETGMHIFPVLVHPQELQVALEQFI